MARKALEPLWLKLPKNDEGKMEGKQVNELLQRYFVQQHELEVVETFQEGEVVSQKEVPAFMLNLFTEIFGTEGLMLHEVSLVAATFDSLLKDESLWEKVADAEDAVEIVEASSSSLVQTAFAGVVVFGALVSASDAARRFGGVEVAKGKVITM